MNQSEIYSLQDAIMNHHNEVAIDLLQSGVDKNCRYEDGSTPIMWAARYGNVEMVRVLIALDADLSIRDNLGYDALNIAGFYGESSMGAYTAAAIEIMDLLERSGCR